MCVLCKRVFNEEGVWRVGCYSLHKESGWRCTKPEGHEGNHAACQTRTDGEQKHLMLEWERCL